MKEKKEKKKSKLWEKILLGAIVGGAIGSVVGASIKQKNKEAIIEEEPIKKRGKLRRILEKMIFTRKKDGLKKLPNEMETEEEHDKK